MKSSLFLFSLFLLSYSASMSAQKTDRISRYETFVYTNERLDIFIRNEYLNQREDREVYHGPLGLAYLMIEKELAGDEVSPIVETGRKPAVGLLSRNKKAQMEWEALIKAENVYQETLNTLGAFNNFYSEHSFKGAIDPSRLIFNGIGCLHTLDGDTAFYFSCHIDVTKFNRIMYDAKFELSLDTLIINPLKGNLPAYNKDASFSFDRYNNLQYVIEIRMIASWLNEMMQLQSDRELGIFVISVPVSPADLDADGKLRYVRTPEAPVRYTVAGESYLVPRSYLGIREEKSHWGTGDFKIEIALKETCGITDDFRKNWKKDWNNRKNAAKTKNDEQYTWKTISSKRWDDTGKQWVITSLKAPSEMTNSDLRNELITN